MNLISFFFSQTDYVNQYIATAINGDLSPTALDQLQCFNGEFVVKESTVYCLYNGNGQATSSWDVDRNFLATKDLTDGLPMYEGWIRYNGGSGDAIPVIDITANDWEGAQVFTRTVINDNGTFKMWYTGHWVGPLNRFSIGYATSTDGITWSRSSSPVIAWDEFPSVGSIGVVIIAVCKESDTLYHALIGGDGNIEIDGAVYLTSTDGQNWTQQATGVLQGEDIRFIKQIRLINGIFYLNTTAGNNPDYYTNGTATKGVVYSTTDFSTFQYLGITHEYDQPLMASGGQGSVFEYNGKYYMGVGYQKNQLKTLVNNGEPFSALKVYESNKPFISQITPTKIYPSYVKRYYPCFQLNESQTPSERITGGLPIVTGTLSWNLMKYVLFTGTQLITYPEYIPSDTTKLAVKARVLPQATLTRQIIRQSDGSNGWAMFLNAGKLQVDLYESTTLKKSYITVNDVVKPAGVYDPNDQTSVGFIFSAGTLKLCFGASANQATTKTIDLTLSNIETGNNDVEIGAGNVTNEMRSFCIFDEITEDQWLNVIDL